MAMETKAQDNRLYYQDNLKVFLIVLSFVFTWLVRLHALVSN